MSKHNLHLIFAILQFELFSLMNLIFSIFQTVAENFDHFSIRYLMNPWISLNTNSIRDWTLIKRLWHTTLWTGAYLAYFKYKHSLISAVSISAIFDLTLFIILS